MSCSSGSNYSSGSSKTVENPRDVEKRTVYYKVSRRQFPPEDVYSRMMWSHLPKPIPRATRSDAPLVNPRFSFEMPNSYLEETIEALSQAIGFRWEIPKQVRSKPVSINQVGTVNEILGLVEKQTGLGLEINYKERIIRVIDPSTLPYLSEKANDTN